MSVNGDELLNTALDAQAFKNAGDWGHAIIEFEKILAAQPDWEHGYGWFNLAECYEDSGRIVDARAGYQKAVLSNSNDPIFQGGFASFLYLHGEAEEAFDAYIRLLALDRAGGNSDAANTDMNALIALASRLGWSSDEVDVQISQRLAAPPA